MSDQEKQEILEIVARALEKEAEVLDIDRDVALTSGGLSDLLNRAATNVRTRISPT
jgi:hypothetical protein